MAKLVFDIETSALPLDKFDEAQQEYLFREAEKSPTKPCACQTLREIERLFSLWPLTAQVVCIAMLNAETQRGQVLFTAEDYDEEPTEGGPVEFVACMDEAELLTAFWDVAKHYEASSPSMAAASTCRSFICARRCSTCRFRARTGSATVTRPSRIATWRSN